MPGISHTPSGQKVATTSSVRPSSSAWVYAAMMARMPSATSAKVICVLIASSDSEVEDRLVERSDVDRPKRREQPLVRKAGEEAVEGPFEVGDVSLGPFRQAHVLEALCVQALLLPRQ